MSGHSGGLMSGGLKTYDRLISRASRRFISKELGSYMGHSMSIQQVFSTDPLRLF